MEILLGLAALVAIVWLLARRSGRADVGRPGGGARVRPSPSPEARRSPFLDPPPEPGAKQGLGSGSAAPHLPAVAGPPPSRGGLGSAFVAGALVGALWPHEGDDSDGVERDEDHDVDEDGDFGSLDGEDGSDDDSEELEDEAFLEDMYLLDGDFDDLDPF